MIRSVLVALALALPVAQAAEADPDTFDPEKRVIFTAEQFASWLAAEKTPVDPARAAKRKRLLEDAWTPAEADVDRIEPLLANLLMEEIERLGDGPLHPSEYYRQYLGQVRDGKRHIVLNAFHETFWRLMDRPKDSWKHELTGAADGGCQFFHAYVEAATGKVTDYFCQFAHRPENMNKGGKKP